MTIHARAATFGADGVTETEIPFEVPERLRANRFLTRLREALEWAILWGVKLAIIFAFLLATWLGFGEFAQTRIGAKQGAAAFQYIQQIEQVKAAQQKGRGAQPTP